jgi:mRNA interferase RelE/StbE
VDKRAEKDIKRVPAHIIEKFAKIIDELEVDPINKRPGVDIKNLRGYSNAFRVRIGEYRVLYSVDKDHIVRIIAVVHRRKAYRLFEDHESYKASENTKRDSLS